MALSTPAGEAASPVGWICIACAAALIEVCAELKKEKEIRSHFDRSACRFRVVHHLGRRNPAAAIGCRPVALEHHEHRAYLPPDRSGVDTGVVDHVAVVRRWDEYGRSGWTGFAGCI